MKIGRLSSKGSPALVGLVSAIVIAAQIWFNYYSHQTADYNRYLLANVMIFFWFPALMALLVSKQEPGNFGMSSVKSIHAWLVAGIAFVGLTVVMIFVSRWQVFQDHYPIYREYTEFWRAFSKYPMDNPYLSAPSLMIYAEASYGLYLFCAEFFFRGYLLFGLQKNIGAIAAVIIQAAVFSGLHYGKPVTEIVGAFIGGIALGILALYAKSFIPGFLLRWFAQIAFNLLIVASRIN